MYLSLNIDEGVINTEERAYQSAKTKFSIKPKQSQTDKREQLEIYGITYLFYILQIKQTHAVIKSYTGFSVCRHVSQMHLAHS